MVLFEGVPPPGPHWEGKVRPETPLGGPDVIIHQFLIDSGHHFSDFFGDVFFDAFRYGPGSASVVISALGCMLGTFPSLFMGRWS